MGADASFIEKIEQLSADTKIFEVAGRPYSKHKLHRIKSPVAEPITVFSLSAVAEYVNRVSEGEDETHPAIIHVEAHDSVTVITGLNSDREREVLVEANFVIDPYQFGKNIDVDRFVVAMQALFVQDDNTSAILSVAGNITAKSEQTTMDDGVTQVVSAKQGIAGFGQVHVPNPVELRPYRTFAEVDQPIGKFVFRMNVKPGETPTCALHEADGGAWKLEAMDNIKAWLDEHIKAHKIIL